MPTVTRTRIAFPDDGPFWETCPSCDRLMPMAPGAWLCDDCANGGLHRPDRRAEEATKRANVWAAEYAWLMRGARW